MGSNPDNILFVCFSQKTNSLRKFSQKIFRKISENFQSSTSIVPGQSSTSCRCDSDMCSPVRHVPEHITLGISVPPQGH